MPGDDLDRLQRERDLYLHLLELGAQDEIEPLLADALALIVDVTSARLGYVQVQDPEGDRNGVGWSMHRGLSGEELARVRASISQGIIAEALETGQTIMTASALIDPRFSARESVRSGQIESVLCVPIGRDPRFGVLYLQGRRGGTFCEEDRSNAERFARHLAPLTERLVVRHRRREATDATRGVRQRLRCDGIIGRSMALARVLEQVAAVAPLELAVLLTGDTGTGKSQLARLLHENSGRAGGPFVEINCATLPENLVESELFGAMPGAHSTATRRIDGKVAAASRGTLVLDEVSELTLPAQAKLLQLLQSAEYYPLGATRPSRADVRIVAATNTDLKVAMAERRFREDLLYRLHVMPIHVPSLAERRDDIVELADHFCRTSAERHGLPRLTLSQGALRSIEHADWPGNVRQLLHTVEAALVRAAGASDLQIEEAHVFPDAHATGTDERPRTFQAATRQFQAKLVRDTLEESGWNVVDAARRLDVARSHLYNLINAFGIARQRK